MTVALGDVLRVAARAVVNGQDDLVNTYHYQLVGGASQSDAVTLIDLGALMEDIYVNLLSYQHSDVVYADIAVFNVTQDRSLGVINWPTIDDGFASGDWLPNQVAAFVMGKTAYIRNTAKKFFGGFTETGNATGGSVGTALLAQLVDAGVAWLAGAPSTGGGDWLPVVWNKKLSIWANITTLVVSTVWSTQRRRRPGRGS